MTLSKIVSRLVAACAIAASFSAPAAAWGPAGHKLVASLAFDLLTPNAKTQVTGILAASYDLGTAAKWADCVRSVARSPAGKFHYVVNPKYQAPCVPFMTPKSEVARMEDYASRNYDNCTGEKPCAADYHFADVPIQAGHYEEGGIGTEEFDVVHAIAAAIDVLQDKPAPAPFSFIDKKEALTLLAHYVGDISQPLHVGSIYLTPSGKVTNPATIAAAAAAMTRGGNWIMISKSENLHGVWDSIPSPWSLAPAHQGFIDAANAEPGTAGPMSGWAQAWADQSIEAAVGAFKDLKFKKLATHKWTAISSDPAGFLKYRHDTQKQQIARGAAHLAAILNAIWP